MAKKIIITLWKSELTYDIRNKVHLIARSREGALEASQTANMQLNEAEEEENQMLRSLGDAYSNMLAKLSPYFCPIVEQREASCGCHHHHHHRTPDRVFIADNVQLEEENNKEFTVPLTMPDNFNEGCISDITAALHKFLVNSVIAEWFLVASPADAGAYLTLAEGDMGRARHGLHSRIKPVRRSLGVF